MVCTESRFPFVALLDADIVVSPADIQLCKVSRSLEAVDQVIYKGEWVPVFAGYCVKRVIVLYKVEFAVLFLDEEDRCTYWRPGRSDATGGEGLL